MTNQDLSVVLPVAIIAVGSLLLLVFHLERIRIPRPFAALVLCGAGFAASLPAANLNQTVMGGMMYADLYYVLFTAFILIGTLLSIVVQSNNLERQRVTGVIDVDVLMLLASTGGMIMVAAGNFVALFLGFEILSLSVYALTGLARKEKGSAEAALKYFVLGAFSSAFLLYGMVLVYGATGSLEYGAIATSLVEPTPLTAIGLGLIVFGFGFKVSAFPFHLWTPDVYQGAPSSITGYMAVVVKAAAFGAFLRLMAVVFGDMQFFWSELIWSLAALTMTVGNVAALRQKSIKRMLAYSSIAHAGYGLIGFLSIDSGLGSSAVVFYMFSYLFMTFGAFAVVLAATAGRDEQYERDDISSFAGLGWKYPLLGLAMALFMFSLAGMPPTVGFIGKFYLFTSAVDAGYVSLAVIAALNSVISLYYYLRVIVVMYFQYDAAEAKELPAYPQFGIRSAIAVSAVCTLVLGVFSEPIHTLAMAAVKQFL